mmetsp:Transcript_30867/g.118373  ORF Transcript_30867/g.118373 Transcript_30867/m.118373 type:complete len:137 (-) Transcript_30867:1494-1904(-)
MPMIKTFLVAPFAPILMIYRGIPFVAFAVYLLVYFLVGKNRNYSYFIRYNAHQAILLDIAILIPQLLFILMTNVPPFFLEGISNAVFFLMVSALDLASALATSLTGSFLLYGYLLCCSDWGGWILHIEDSARENSH